jgi:hypothetical protein
MSEGQIHEIYDWNKEKLRYVLYILDDNEDVTSFDPESLLGLVGTWNDIETSNVAIVLIRSSNPSDFQIVGLMTPAEIRSFVDDLDPKTLSKDTMTMRDETAIQFPKRVPPVILRCSTNPHEHPQYVIRSKGPNQPQNCKIDNAPLVQWLGK